MNCTLRLSSTMTRLDHNRNARARRAVTQEARPLWAGKSSANAAASLRGQFGEAARGEGARILAGCRNRFLHNRAQSLPLLVAALFGSCVCVLHPLLRLLRQRPASWLIVVGGINGPLCAGEASISYKAFFFCLLEAVIVRC